MGPMHVFLRLHVEFPGELQTRAKTHAKKHKIEVGPGTTIIRMDWWREGCTVAEDRSYDGGWQHSFSAADSLETTQRLCDVLKGFQDRNAYYSPMHFNCHHFGMEVMEKLALGRHAPGGGA